MGQSVQVYRDGELINTREYNAGELFLIFFLSLSRARSLVFARSSALFLSLCLPPRPLPSLALPPVPFPPSSLRQLLSRHRFRPSLQAKTGVS